MTPFEAAQEALANGFCPVPPRQDGTKAPDGQWRTYIERLPTPAEVDAWWGSGQRTGLGVVCGAVSGNLEMLEFEGRAVDDGMLDEFNQAAQAVGLGDLVARVVSGFLESTPSGGRHLLYRVSGPIAGNTKLARRVTPDGDIEVLLETRGEGGYVVTAPSHGAVHPSGQPWTLMRGGFATIATITPDERDALHQLARTFDAMPATEIHTPAPAHGLEQHGDRPGDWWNAQPDVQAITLELLQAHGWTAIYERGGTIYLRRPGKTVGVSATLGHIAPGVLRVFTTSTVFEDRAHDAFGVYARLEHGGDIAGAARATRAVMPKAETWNPPSQIQVSTAGDASDVPGEREALPDDNPAPLHLPDEVWDARPELAHIRQAARSRLVAPDAVLGAVLARIAACTPHTVELPPTIGTAVGLTFYTALVGPPGTGKSAAANVAAELVPAGIKVLDRMPIGSGEGMVEVLFEMRPDPDNEKKLVKTQVFNAAIFHIDEGQVLADLGGRSGSTLMPTLRSAWTHGKLGQANASLERRRLLDGRMYVYGITLGIQPELAGPLLADTAGGTPQRFLWLMSTDPTAPDDPPDWPGPVAWTPPDRGALERQKVGGAVVRHRLTIDPAIRAEVIAHRQAVNRGEGDLHAGDEHRMLLRLKMAALLGILDGRLDVNLDDWAIADLILATSGRTRAGISATLAAVAERAERTRNEQRARGELVVEDAKASKALTAASRAVARKVTRHAANLEHDGAGCVRACLTLAISGRHRHEVSTDDAASEAARHGWIIESRDRWLPGKDEAA